MPQLLFGKQSELALVIVLRLWVLLRRVSYPQSADPVASVQCQWQMAEGRQRDSLLPTSSVNERTEQRTCRLRRAVSVLGTVACGRL
jgi:hypothetical protein